MKSSLLLQNGHLINPATGIDAKKDILIENGVIQQINDPGQTTLCDKIETLNISGMSIIPGLIDLWHQLREPGYTGKGTIISESKAALSGGVTTLCCPPETSPVLDNTAVIKMLKLRSQQESLANILFIGALTKSLNGEQMSEMKTLIDAGCVALSNGLKAIPNSQMMKRLMEYAQSYDIGLMISPQDYWLSQDCCAHDGVVSSRMGIKGSPEQAETIALQRDLELLALTGARAHFCQISTARGIDIIRDAKQSGLPITADVSINHLLLSEMDIDFDNSYCHVTPPFRTMRDQQALIRGIKDNTIDAIVSAHQPHDLDAKLAPFEATEPGISNTDILLSLSIKLAQQENISLMQILSKLTCNPANIIALDKASLELGKIADCCIVDTNKMWTYDKQDSPSMGKNSPYHGWDLPARVAMTLVQGKVAYQDKSSSLPVK